MRDKTIAVDKIIDEIVNLYGLPDHHGYIYVENKDPSTVEKEIKEALKNDSAKLYLGCTLCSYVNGTIIKV